MTDGPMNPDREELIRILAQEGIRFPEEMLNDLVIDFVDLKHKIALVRQAMKTIHDDIAETE